MHTSAMLLCVLKFSHQTVCRNVSAAEIILILCLKLRQLICVELMCSVRLLYLPELRDGGRRSRAQVCQQRPRSRNPPKGLSSLNPTISLENDGFIFLCYIYIWFYTFLYHHFLNFVMVEITATRGLGLHRKLRTNGHCSGTSVLEISSLGVTCLTG